MAGRIRTVLEMIKFEHSVFALPFALTGALLAARATLHGWPTLRQVLWIVVAMVAARSAAMTLNRIADVRYDKENPRTKTRALATGALSVSFAWTFTLLAVAVFFVAAWQLNSLALKLAPVAIANRIVRVSLIDCREIICSISFWSFSRLSFSTDHCAWLFGSRRATECR